MLKVLDETIEVRKDNVNHVRAIISVNSADELVTETGTRKFTEASFALVLSTGDTYAMTNGSWVKQ